MWQAFSPRGAERERSPRGVSSTEACRQAWPLTGGTPPPGCRFPSIAVLAVPGHTERGELIRRGPSGSDTRTVGVDGLTQDLGRNRYAPCAAKASGARDRGAAGGSRSTLLTRDSP